MSISRVRPIPRRASGQCSHSEGEDASRTTPAPSSWVADRDRSLSSLLFRKDSLHSRLLSASVGLTGSRGGPKMNFSLAQIGMPTLIVKMNGNVTRVPVRHVAVVGRDKGCDVVLEGDKLASRQNAKIYTDGRRFLVEDLGSRNGTFLNGVKVVRPQMLHDGDEIRVGGAVIRFEDPAAAAAASGPAATPAPRPSFRRAAVPSASDEAVRAFFGLFSFLLLALIFGTTLVLSKFLFTLMLKG